MRLLDLGVGQSVKFEFVEVANNKKYQRVLVGMFGKLPKGKAIDKKADYHSREQQERGVFLGYLKGINTLMQVDVYFVTRKEDAGLDVRGDRPRVYMNAQSISPTRMPKELSTVLRKAVGKIQRKEEEAKKLAKLEAEHEKKVKALSDKRNKYTQEALQELEVAKTLLPDAEVNLEELTPLERGHIFYTKFKEISNKDKGLQVVSISVGDEDKSRGEYFALAYHNSSQFNVWDGSVHDYDYKDGLRVIRDSHMSTGKAVADELERFKTSVGAVNVELRAFVSEDWDERMTRYYPLVIFGIAITGNFTEEDVKKFYMEVRSLDSSLRTKESRRARGGIIW